MIISKTPLRISFAGGGTDLPSFYRISNIPGAVINASINRYVYITVNRKFDNLIRVSYSKTEIVKNLDDLEHNIIRESLRLLGIHQGVEIVYMADLPLGGGGSGLGSSSALAVGVLNALHAYLGQFVTAEQLAREAIQIEMEILNYPVGKQDQYAAAYGGINHITFNMDESVLVEPVFCSRYFRDLLSDNLMLLYTGIDRISSNILADQQKNTKDKLIENLQMLDLVKQFKNALISESLNDVGAILHKGWLIKKQLAEGVSSNKIDAWYDKALSLGAKGGKIAGAGGGGFLLLQCPVDLQKKLEGGLPELVNQKVYFEPFGSRIIHASE